MTPAPSLSTNPSRSLSKGRLAPSGIIVARRQRPRRGEAAETDRRGRHLGTAGDHRIDDAVANHVGRLTDVVGPGAAGGDDGEVRPLEPYLMDRSPATMLTMLAGTKNGEILRGPPSRIGRVVVLDAGDAADAGAHGHADALARLVVDRQPRRLDGLGAAATP
jgi:hypothetical protein